MGYRGDNEGVDISGCRLWQGLLGVDPTDSIGLVVYFCTWYKFGMCSSFCSVGESGGSPVTHGP